MEGKWEIPRGGGYGKGGAYQIIFGKVEARIRVAALKQSFTA